MNKKFIRAPHLEFSSDPQMGHAARVTDLQGNFLGEVIPHREHCAMRYRVKINDLVVADCGQFGNVFKCFTNLSSDDGVCPPHSR